MLGAIAGDIIGSTREVINTKDYSFDLFPPGSMFTDDTVLTVAVADCILHKHSYVEVFKRYFALYRDQVGWGERFIEWASGDSVEPYYSFGNGSAMRVSAIGWAYDELDEVIVRACESAAITHNHPEGIKGAVAVAAAIFLARKKRSREQIRATICALTGYDLSRTIANIRPDYSFHVSCQKSVPEAIIAFLEGKNFEDTIRLAVSIGGDSDTIACIAGSIAEAYYGGVPNYIKAEVLQYLDTDLLRIVQKFNSIYVADI